MITSQSRSRLALARPSVLRAADSAAYLRHPPSTSRQSSTPFDRTNEHVTVTHQSTPRVPYPPNPLSPPSVMGLMLPPAGREPIGYSHSREPTAKGKYLPVRGRNLGLTVFRTQQILHFPTKLQPQSRTMTAHPQRPDGSSWRTCYQYQHHKHPYHLPNFWPICTTRSRTRPLTTSFLSARSSNSTTPPSPTLPTTPANTPSIVNTENITHPTHHCGAATMTHPSHPTSNGMTLTTVMPKVARVSSSSGTAPQPNEPQSSSDDGSLTLVAALTLSPNERSWPYNRVFDVPPKHSNSAQPAASPRHTQFAP